MKILGLRFAGTATEHRAEMNRFVTDVLGLPRRDAPHVEADLYALPDQSTFAVASPGGMGSTSRSLGFLVADLDEAIAELQRCGTPVGTPGNNGEERYVHFTAPDGQLYELVECVAS